MYCHPFHGYLISQKSCEIKHLVNLKWSHSMLIEDVHIGWIQLYYSCSIWKGLVGEMELGAGSREVGGVTNLLSHIG